MTVESAITFFLAILIFGVTPGPGVFAILARALSEGAKACTSLSLGMAVSDVVYMVAACLGLATLATHWGEVFTVVRIVGAAYLLYLGWKMFTSPINLDEADPGSKKAGHIKGFMQGFLISASNPKVILFYIAFLPTFMDLTVLDTGDIVLASVLNLTALMMGLTGIAVFASKVRLLMKTERAQKRLNQGAGSIMMGAGVFLASKG